MITGGEYNHRISRLKELVQKNNLDAFLVTSEESIYYLTGVSYKPLERPFFIIIKPDEGVSLLVPEMEREHMAEAPNIKEVTSYWEYPSPKGQGWIDKLNELLTDKIALGVEPSLPQEIAECLPNDELKTLPLIENMRLVKSKAEVEMIRKSAYYADLSVDYVLKSAYYGVSELELFSQARNVQIKAMKEGTYDVVASSILTAAWPAPMSAQPHSIPSIDDILKEGPHIALSLIRLNAYSSECERTFFLAPPTKEMIKAFKVMTEARNIGFSMIRPGIECAVIDEVVKEFLKKEGYEGNLLHRTGHGFGLGTHEGPWIAEGSEHVLAKNMVISIEPGIYINDLGGIRHSDTVLITDNGYERLTKYPVDLESLTIKANKPIQKFKGGIIKHIIRAKN